MAGEFVIDSPQKLKSKLEMVILFHFLFNMSILSPLTSFSSLLGCAVGGSLRWGLVIFLTTSVPRL